MKLDNMSKKRQSESLFSKPAAGSSYVKAPPRKTDEERRADAEKIKKALKKDYIFRSELKDKVESELSEEHRSIIHELEEKKEHSSLQELAVIKRVNERKKRHYDINGNVVVYCYVKHLEWPHIVVKPLTISLDESDPIPSLGPFEGENEFLLEVSFRPITLQVKNQIDQFVYEPTNEGPSSLLFNMDEYKRLAFISCFDSWNLPFELEVKNKKLTKDSIEKISNKLHPRILDIVSSAFVNLNDISEEEIKVLDRQSERLFSKNSQGVNNPSEGIRLYCEANVLAKEFYLSGSDLNDLPYRVSTMIRYVSNKGNEIHARQMDQSSGGGKGAKVIRPRKG
jgi:hypothetical protein